MATKTAAVASPSAAYMKSEHDYQAESDLRTMHEAHKIKNDPERHGRMKAKASQQMAMLKGLTKK